MSPAKKVGRLVKAIAALSEQFSNLFTEMPFFRP